MESILLSALAYSGMKLSKSKTLKDKKKHIKKRKGKKKLHTKNIYMRPEFSYHSTNKKIIEEKIKQDAKNMNIRRKRSSSKQRPEYLNQFDPLTVNLNPPVEINQTDGIDINLQRELSLEEGFSSFNGNTMNYGIFPENELFHNNMVPHTSRRDLGVINANNTNRKMELMTGNISEYKPKRESQALFEPMADITNATHIPITSQGLETRYSLAINDKKNNGDLPFEHDIKVHPGINGKKQKGRNSVYRINPRGTDELRGKHNPKLIFKAQKIESGLKESRRAKKTKIHKI